MSGHSKWSTIKHKKAAADAKRGQMFSKLTRAITVAARAGGGNPDMNATLASAVEKAREYNMPMDNIDRAIKRGTGQMEGAQYEEFTYEGFGPAGVALIVHIMTDNRNRAAAEIRHIFNKFGGNLGGSVGWMFERKGVILVPKDAADEDTLLTTALDIGAEDMRTEDDHWEVLTDPSQFKAVKEGLEAAGIGFTSAEITMIPQNTVSLSREEAVKVLRIVDALEDHDDVQEVWANFDISDQVMGEIAATV